MGKFDKDRYQKELAIRYCLARRMTPYLEVVVSSASDLSDSVEVLTDIDVLGLEFIADGMFRRTIFDCKTGRMSAINRAFWAAGLTNYTKCDDAIVILKSRAVDNHRLSALSISVDLHDENSMIELGRTYDQAFDHDLRYQSSIDRWNAQFEIYSRNSWAAPLFSITRNLVPLSLQPWSPFRRVVGELRGARGQFDPSKEGHLSIYFDALASAFVLWSSIGKDIRRFYQPSMSRIEFETILRYYIWGGKEAYGIRQELAPKNEDGKTRPLELPGWERLIAFAGIVIAAPQELFGCVNICQALSIRSACGISAAHDASLKHDFALNKRARQFILSLNDYMLVGCNLPRDLGERAKQIVGEF